MSDNLFWPDPPSFDQVVVRLRPGDAAPLWVLSWTGERNLSLRPATTDERSLADPDPLVFATPGLFDAQINGYWGRGFKDTDLDAAGLRDLCRSIALTGSTAFLPTLTTDATEVLQTALAQLNAACRQYPDMAALVAGIHLEGPWISPDDGPRGAHPRAHVRPPSLSEWENLQTAAGGRIKMLTLAPEIDGAIELIREVSRQGVAVCLGHHNADAPTIQQAIEAGARGVTHLGNGCHNLLPRHPNLLWEQAAQDRLAVGLIADGHHVPPATARVFYRAKPHRQLFLVSDAIRMAGAPPGLYRAEGGIAEMTAQGRFGFYRSPTLIGAAVPLARVLANLTDWVGQDTPADLIDYATLNPADLVGVAHLVAAWNAPAAPATWVLWRWQPHPPNLTPLRIVVWGRTLYDVHTRPVSVPFGRPEPAVQ